MSDAKVSALDAEILRNAFQKAAHEEGIPEDRWRDYAAQMIRDYTGVTVVDGELLEWIMRNSQRPRHGAYSPHEAASASRPRQ
jgi:hypothetical protein